VAEVKWIKITTDIFDDEKILLIESLPEADSIIVIWFKLLCLAGKMNNSGVFMLNDKVAYTDKMLSTIFRRKESTVKLAIETFVQFGMVEVVDDVITIPNWGKHQDLDKLESRKEYMREYMQEYRAKQKDKICKVNSKVNSKVNVNTLDNISISNSTSKNNISISFEDIYKEYPRKGEKKKAFSCFQTRLKEGYSEEELLIATKNYAEQCKKEKREQRYIKLASTFFGVNTPFVDYLPKGGTGNYSKSMEYGRKIYQGDESRTAPYFGFPPEWFEGEQLIEERITPLVCDKSYVQGGREDYEFTVEELKGIYESRKRGKQYEQCFDDIFDS
jgi:predicted phage replisome organizer